MPKMTISALAISASIFASSVALWASTSSPATTPDNPCVQALLESGATLPAMVSTDSTSYQVLRTEGDVSTDMINTILGELQSVDSFMAPQFKPTPQTDMAIKREFDNAYYDPGHQFMMLTWQIVFNIPEVNQMGDIVNHQRLEVSPEKTRSVDRHELGHNYWFNNLVERDERYKIVFDLTKEVTKIQDRLQELEDELNRILERLRVLGAHAEAQALVAELNRRMAEIAEESTRLTHAQNALKKLNSFYQKLHNTHFLLHALKPGTPAYIAARQKIQEDNRIALRLAQLVLASRKNLTPTEEIQTLLQEMRLTIDEVIALQTSFDKDEIEQLMLYQYISGGYNELFGDLVATVSMNNPNAIAEALSHSDMSPEMQESMDDRGYEEDHHEEEWTESEIHVIYAPMGSYLWEFYFQNELYKDHKLELLSLYYDVALSEISRILFEMNDNDLLNVSNRLGQPDYVKEMNQRLQDRFEEAVKPLRESLTGAQ